jgi:hypothetical protein
MILKKSQFCMILMMASFAAMSDVDEGKGKGKMRFNERLAARRKQMELKKTDGEDSDSGSECEVTDVYAPDFKEKWAALVKQKKLEKELEKAQSQDKKDDGDLDSGSK